MHMARTVGVCNPTLAILGGCQIHRLLYCRHAELAKKNTWGKSNKICYFLWVTSGFKSLDDLWVQV